MQARFSTKSDAMRFRDDLTEKGMSGQIYKGHREYVVQFAIPPEDYELKILPNNAVLAKVGKSDA